MTCLSIEDTMDVIEDTILLLYFFRKKGRNRCSMEKEKQRQLTVRPNFELEKIEKIILYPYRGPEIICDSRYFFK